MSGGVAAPQMPNLNQMGDGMVGGLNQIGDGMINALNTAGRLCDSARAEVQWRWQSGSFRGGGFRGGGFSGGGFSGGGRGGSVNEQ